MPYRISWTEPDTILTVTLTDDVTLDEFAWIGQEVNKSLDARDTGGPVALIVDASGARSVPREFQHLKPLQTYLDRSDLKWLLIVTPNKLIRLLMLLIFNLSRPRLWLFDNLEAARQFSSTLRVYSR